MSIVNHTLFPAQAFEAIDQHEQKFYVFVLRQTLDFSQGVLRYADRQSPLCDRDSYFSDDYTGSLRQESDYCPYKPRCDVIVNATAYAPRGKPVEYFFAGLKIVRGDLRLIEKVLKISGERLFRKKSKFIRLSNWLLRMGTLFLLRPKPWKLTAPKLFTSLPVRYEFAYGGECRIDCVESAAKRVPSKYRLTSQQLETHPDAGAANVAAPVAHAVFESNAVGSGFAPHWYLHASRKTCMPAPRIEYPDSLISAEQFWRAQRSPDESWMKTDPAGFGVRSKLHPNRRALLGEVDDDFVRSDRPLPEDFDFGIWNAAPLDQQTEFLTGGDVIELFNLCPQGIPRLLTNDRGNSVLRLTLPEHECFVRLHLDGGRITTRPLAIDTALVEPEGGALTLVWRVAIPCEEIGAVLSSEFCMRTFTARNRARCDLHGYSWHNVEAVGIQ